MMDKGFTLIELIAVIVVMAIIALIATPQVIKIVETSSLNADIQTAKTIIKEAKLRVIANENRSDVFENLNLTESKINGRIDYEGKDFKFFFTSNNKCYIKLLGSEEIIINDNKPCSYENELTKKFEYIGNYQTFKSPYTSRYLVELWGASGANHNDLYGRGAYTKGIIDLKANDTLYVYIGEKGKMTTSNNETPFTFNGGGSGGSGFNIGGYNGGGATDVRLKSGAWNESTSLSSRIMVAAGGGGQMGGERYSSYSGGAGGALKGINGNKGLGATQISGGGFGVGENGKYGANDNYRYWEGGGGTGGGYYGGKASVIQTLNNFGGGGGGSSYISGYTGCIAIKSEADQTPKDGCEEGTNNVNCSIHYSTKVFLEPMMKSGNEVMPDYTGGNKTGNLGNGYALITRLE